MAKNGVMKRSLRFFGLLAFFELLFFQPVVSMAGVAPGSTLTQEWQGLKDHLAQQPNLPQTELIERFRRRLLPLKDRLERILPVQRTLLQAAEPHAAKLSPWLVENLRNSALLTEIDQELAAHPRKKEIAQAVEEAAGAQKKGLDASLSGGKDESRRWAAKAAELTQTALDLLANRDQPPKEGDPKQPPQTGEQKQSPAGDPSQPSESKQNQPKPKNQKSDSSASKPSETPNSATKPDPQRSAPDSAATSSPLDSKEALKSLLKLQAQAQEQKKARREKLGVFQSGPEPVEKDW